MARLAAQRTVGFMLINPLWKLGVIGASTIALTLGVALTFQTLAKRSVEIERDTLSRRINDEDTGYIVRLNQSRTNVRQLNSDIDRQNTAIAAMQVDHEAILAAARDALLIAERDAETAIQRIGRLRDYQVDTDEVCEGVLAFDAFFVAELSQ